MDKLSIITVTLVSTTPKRTLKKILDIGTYGLRIRYSVFFMYKVEGIA